MDFFKLEVGILFSDSVQVLIRAFSNLPSFYINGIKTLTYAIYIVFVIEILFIKEVVGKGFNESRTAHNERVSNLLALFS